MAEAQDFGLAAEATADRLLEAWGFEILERRYRAPGQAELDRIVRRDGRYLYVEVKARHRPAAWEDRASLLAYGTRQSARQLKSFLAYLTQHKSAAKSGFQDGEALGVLLYLSFDEQNVLQDLELIPL